MGDRDFRFDIKIGEKPDNRVKPEVYFEPNGATIEGDGDDLRYVYKYDGEGHAPLMYLRYDDKEIEIKEDASIMYGQIRIEDEKTVYSGELPCNLGTYEVQYIVNYNDYVNDSDKDKYFNVSVTVIVEIKE